MIAPSLIQKARNAAKSAQIWILAGMPVVSNEDHAARLKICRRAIRCEAYNPGGYGGTGECLSCGCSVDAKAWLATEPCPLGFWGIGSEAPESLETPAAPPQKESNS